MRRAAALACLAASVAAQAGPRESGSRLDAARAANGALVLTVTPSAGWHTYWVNPGDAGMPPTISVDGKPVLALELPAPEKIVGDGVTSFGFRHRLTIRASVPKGSRAAEFRWVMCDGRQCVPERTTLDLATLRAASSAAIAAPLPAAGVRWLLAGRHAQLSLPAQSPKPVASAYFFPLTPGLVRPRAPQHPERLPGRWWRLTLATNGAATPLDGVLGVRFADGSTAAYAIPAHPERSYALGR